MPKKSKNPSRPTRQAADDPQLYAHAYAARLAKQVAAELEPARPAARSRKKTAAKRA